MDQNWGKYIIIVGVVIVVLGAIIYFLGGKLHWIGNLPGDFRIERENFRFYFPFTTMILISLLLTLVINVVKRLF
jgi:magnesium-transporting ATPase (P-type)